MKLSLSAGLIVGALALPLFAATLSQPEGIEVGTTAEYTFQTAPVNAMGVKSLEDLRGKPVLVEFWGTK